MVSWKSYQDLVDVLSDIPRIHLNSMGKNPITIKSIDKLIIEGWEVSYIKNKLTVLLGGLIPDQKKIVIKSTLTPYQRDLTLFHELAHIHYPYSKSNDNTYRYKWNEIFIEKIARDTRINPELLRHAITTFGLEQHIYDEASYQAFYPKNKNQLKFFFYSKTRKKKLLTLID